MFAGQCYNGFVWEKLLSVLAYHHCDVTMGTMGSKITRLTIAYSTVYSDTNQRKHQSSAPLTFVGGTHRWIPTQRANNAENVSIWWRHHRFVWGKLLLVLAYFTSFIIIWFSTLWHIKFVSFCISSYPRPCGLLLSSSIEIKLYQNGHSFVTTLTSNVVGNVNPAMYIIVTSHGHHEVSNH